MGAVVYMLVEAMFEKYPCETVGASNPSGGTGEKDTNQSVKTRMKIRQKEKEERIGRGQQPVQYGREPAQRRWTH